MLQDFTTFSLERYLRTLGTWPWSSAFKRPERHVKAPTKKSFTIDDILKRRGRNRQKNARKLVNSGSKLKSCRVYCLATNLFNCQRLSSCSTHKPTSFNKICCRVADPLSKEEASASPRQKSPSKKWWRIRLLPVPFYVWAWAWPWSWYTATAKGTSSSTYQPAFGPDYPHA